MKSLLIVITGTGTDIGKTHFAEALLRSLAPYRRVIGLKPVETGLANASASDGDRLERASSFHVQPFGRVFAEGLSPHLAARRAGEPPIELGPLISAILDIRTQSDVTIVELAGGLFTPLSDTVVNADLARQLDADATLLVAPDRLGVLHDVISTARAADSVPLDVSGVVLVTPEFPDASSGQNAPEIQRLIRPPLLLTVPRATVSALAALSMMLEVADFIGA